VFFFQIGSSSLYLFAVQISGEFGHNNDPNFQRYKNDALKYYNEDIAWFSYSFVCFVIHVSMLYKYYARPSDNDQGKKTMLTIYMIILSLTRIALLQPYRMADRKLKEFSTMKWIVLFVLELAAVIPFFFFKYIMGNNTFNCYLIDLMCLTGMFIIYKMNEMANTRSGDNFLKFLHLTPQHSQKALKRQDKKARPFKVDNSIYNMALYTLIDPVLIDEMQTEYVDNSDGKVSII